MEPDTDHRGLPTPASQVAGPPGGDSVGSAPTSRDRGPTSAAIWRGRGRLAAALLVILVIWGGVLPRLAEWDRIRAYGTHLERHGVAPAAMFYSELAVAERARQRIRQRQQRHPGLFWDPAVGGESAGRGATDRAR